MISKKKTKSSLKRKTSSMFISPKNYGKILTKNSLSDTISQPTRMSSSVQSSSVMSPLPLATLHRSSLRLTLSPENKRKREMLTFLSPNFPIKILFLNLFKPDSDPRIGQTLALTKPILPFSSKKLKEFTKLLRKSLATKSL